MSELNLKVSLTDVEKNQLAGLIALWEGSDKWQQQALYFSDRSRAIDQIKRLYAVIMGFALTTAIGNAYLCLRMLKPELKSFDAYLLIIAPLIPFVSLLALFYLGAERLLDRKYLEENPQVTPHKLGLDLATVGLASRF